MKKRILSIVLAGVLAIGSGVVYGDETTDVNSEILFVNEVEAGITPDSLMYALDKLMEEIQLSLEDNLEKEAELLIEFAKERLSEAVEMTEKEKEELVKKAMDNYLEKLEQAQDRVSEIVITEEDRVEQESSEVDPNLENEEILKSEEEIYKEIEKEYLNDRIELLISELEEITEVAEDIKEVLDEATKEKIEEKTDSAYLVAAVVKDLDLDIVKKIRGEKELGYGQIAQVFLLADASGMTVEEVAELFSGEDVDNEKGFGEIAKKLGLSPSMIKAKAAQNIKNEIEDDILTTEKAMYNAIIALEKIEEGSNKKEIKNIRKTMIKTTKELEKAKKKKIQFEKKLSKYINLNVKDIDEGIGLDDILEEIEEYHNKEEEEKYKYYEKNDFKKYEDYDEDDDDDDDDEKNKKKSKKIKGKSKKKKKD